MNNQSNDSTSKSRNNSEGGTPTPPNPIDRLNEILNNPVKNSKKSEGFKTLGSLLGNSKFEEFDTKGLYGKSKYDEEIVVARDIDFENLEESFEEQRDYYRQQDVDKGLDVTAFVLAIIAILLILTIITRKINIPNRVEQTVNDIDNQSIQSFSNVVSGKSDVYCEIKDASLITEFTLRYINIRKSFRIPEEKVFTILNLSKKIVESRSFLNIPESYIKEISSQFVDNSIMQIFSILYFEAKLTNDVFFIDNKSLIYDSILVNYNKEMGTSFLNENFLNNFSKLDKIFDKAF